MVNPNPNRIRNRVALATNAKARAGIRADEALLALPDVSRGVSISLRGREVVFERPPQPILDGQGNVVGLDAMVRVYIGGVEQQVDPHRVCINPPTSVPDGTSRQVVTYRGDAVQVPNTREDPREAYLNWLLDSLVRTPNPAGWNTPGTVTTIYAGANDGQLNSNNTSSNYALARSGDVIYASEADAVNGGGQWFFGAEYGVITAVAQFDTSVLSGQVVSAVQMGLWGINDWSNNDFVLQVRTYDYGATITSGDYVPGANLSAFPLLATYDSASGWTIGAYNLLVPNGAGLINAINTAGVTSVILCSDDDVSGTAPTGNEGLDWSSADQAGTTQDPYLTITHSNPPPIDYRSHPTHALREANTPAGSPLR